MKTVDLDVAGWEEVYPGVRRRTASAERMTLTLYRFDSGAAFPMHHHDQEQLALVRRGAVEFHNARARITCRANELIIIPPNEPHGATAGPEGADVVSVVSPARRGVGDYTVEGSG